MLETAICTEEILYPIKFVDVIVTYDALVVAFRKLCWLDCISIAL